MVTVTTTPHQSATISVVELRSLLLRHGSKYKMERVVAGRSNIAQQLSNLLQRYDGTIVGPYEHSLREEKRLIGAKSDRELLNIVAEAISEGKMPSVVLMTPKMFGIYSLALVELCTRYDIPFVLMTLAATPLDRGYDEKRWRELTIAQFVKKPGKKLIITSEGTAQVIKQEYDLSWVPQQNRRSYAIVATTLNEKNASIDYDHLLVYDVLSASLANSNNDNDNDNTTRSVHEYAVFQTLATNLYYYGAKEPTIDFHYQHLAEEIDDCCLIVSQHLLREEIPQSLVDRFASSYSILQRLDLLDRYGMHTDAGKRVVRLTLSVIAATFLDRWVQAGQPVFPGIVIATWLNRPLILPAMESEETESPLLRYLRLWHDLTIELQSNVLTKTDEERQSVKNWADKRKSGEIDSSHLLALCANVNRLVELLQINLFGLFHPEEAVKRAADIIGSIYEEEGVVEIAPYGVSIPSHLTVPRLNDVPPLPTLRSPL